MRKKLWMKIAKYLFNYQGKKKNKMAATNTQTALFGVSGLSSGSGPGKYKISEALEILGDRLKIDDLLPLFPPDEKV
jgi:hypothetical protein